MSALSDSDFAAISARMRADRPNSKAIVKESLKSKEDRLRFADWIHRQALKSHEHRMQALPTTDALRAEVMKTDFRDKAQVAQLLGTINCHAFPYIGLGTYKGHHYRLAPAIEQLKSTHRPDWKDTRTILPANILGFNKTDISHKRKRSRKERYSDSSEESAGSENCNDETGFVFFQLGCLQHTPSEAFNNENPMQGFWLDTTYIVVVVINLNGHAGDVYILHNFEPDESDWSDDEGGFKSEGQAKEEKQSETREEMEVKMLRSEGHREQLEPQGIVEDLGAQRDEDNPESLDKKKNPELPRKKEFDAQTQEQQLMFKSSQETMRPQVGDEKAQSHTEKEKPKSKSKKAKYQPDVEDKEPGYHWKPYVGKEALEPWGKEKSTRAEYSFPDFGDFLPGDNVRRSGARIAKRFDELKHGSCLSIPGRGEPGCITEPGEFVRAVEVRILLGTAIVRQYRVNE